MFRALSIAAILFFLATSFAVAMPDSALNQCGTEALPASLSAEVQRQLSVSKEKNIAKSEVTIPVAVHLILSGRKGDFSLAAIQTLIDNMNWAYDGTGIRFQLVKVDRTNKKAWHLNCATAKNEAAMKKKLAYYPSRVLNIYSCYLGGNTLGRATFPFGNYPPVSYTENHFMQGFIMAPNTMPVTTSLPDYKYGLVAAHEAGHWLGLLHTFHPGTFDTPSDCSGEGDQVADTPAQRLPSGSCVQYDTCPQPGSDDYTNFMDYRPDHCADHFSDGQIDRMWQVLQLFRPSLLQ